MKFNLKKSSESLELPGGIISLIAGIMGIVKDTHWIVYTLLILVSIVLIVLFYWKKSNKYSDFEVLSQVETLDLSDYKNCNASYSIELLIKSLKQNASEIFFNLYYDGTIQNPNLERGKIKNIDYEGKKAIFKIIPPSPIKKGDTHLIKLKCNLKNSFNNSNEYWEMNKFAKTSNLKLFVIFPEDRKPKTIQSFLIYGHKKTISKHQPRLISIDSKTALLFELESSDPMEKNRIQWTW